MAHAAAAERFGNVDAEKAELGKPPDGFARGRFIRFFDAFCLVVELSGGEPAHGLLQRELLFIQ